MERRPIRTHTQERAEPDVDAMTGDPRRPLRREQGPSPAAEAREADAAAIVEGLTVGVFRVGLDGRFLFGNLALARLYRLDSRAGLDDIVFDWCTLDPQARGDLIETLDHTHGAIAFGGALRRADGTYGHAYGTARAVRDLRGDVVHYEGFLSDAPTWSADANPESALQDLVHDLATPLTPIKIQVALLLAGQRGALDRRQADALRVIARSADRLEGTVRRLRQRAPAHVADPHAAHG